MRAPSSEMRQTPGARWRPSRRQVLRASLIGGIAVYLAPLGSRAFASLFEHQLLTRPDWSGRDGVLKYRIDGTSKVTGEKVFARDIRARDMPHWPQQQAHALVLRTTKADRTYAGFDLSLLDDDLKPDRVVMAADLTRDGLAFPAFYGEDMLLPEGKTPAYLGQAVAILIFRDFVHFRFAKEKLQFNDANIRYGAITGPLHRDPWGASRFVRVGGKTPYDDDVFSCLKDGPISPSHEKHEPVWPAPARNGDLGAQGMFYAKAIDDELAHPPAEWVVLTRRYATQSGDTAPLEPDNANGWYDSDKQELHLVVPTQSPQEVAEGAATMLQRSRIGLKRLFLHPYKMQFRGSRNLQPQSTPPASARAQHQSRTFPCVSPLASDRLSERSARAQRNRPRRTRQGSWTGSLLDQGQCPRHRRRPRRAWPHRGGQGAAGAAWAREF